MKTSIPGASGKPATPAHRAAIAAAALTACVAAAQAGEVAPRHAASGTPAALASRPSTDELKRLYLACSRAAESGGMGTARIAQCSVVYELLKRHAFDGDFEKLHAWSTSQH